MSIKKQIADCIQSHPSPGSPAAIYDTYQKFYCFMTFHDFRRTVNGLGFYCPSLKDRLIKNATTEPKKTMPEKGLEFAKAKVEFTRDEIKVHLMRIATGDAIPSEGDVIRKLMNQGHIQRIGKGRYRLAA